MLQSNWICKSTVCVPVGAGVANHIDRISSGHLRAVSWEVFQGGVTNARPLCWRIPKLKLSPLSFSPALAGFADWVRIYASSGVSQMFFVDMESAAAFEFWFSGDVNVDNHPIQFSFWYEPEDGDDDSHLSPLGNNTRGGIKA